MNNFKKDEKVNIIPQKELKELAKITQEKQELEQKIPQLVKKEVETEIQKIEIMNKNEAMRYRYPQRINDRTDPDRKPESDLPFSYLRRMAQIYPIARACINRRIRQITQLEWDITTIDEIEEEAGYKKQIKIVKDFFKHPMGHNTRMRELLTIMADDVLTVDAITFEKQRTRGGTFLSLVPVDPTTIALRVTETGGTPEPPDPAYVQIIAGQKIDEFTTFEMLYEFMGNRSYSPYGFAPLESLILQVESAIRGALYNLNYFRENNIPEGFITLPEDIANNKSMVEEWQLWFDSLVAGDPRFTHRLKILPGGSEYTAAKKPEDMSFERFELWLLQQTCAVFDVQPQDIGITLDVNKASGETQSQIGKERGLIPLAMFLKEIFDDLIQIDMGLEYLQLVWLNINPKDRKEEIEIAEKEINMGALGVDEYRQEQGREPLGLDAYIKTGTGPILVKDFISGKAGPVAQMAQQQKQIEQDGKPKDQDDKEAEKMELIDLRNWKKCIYKDLDLGRKLRTKFPSSYISPELHYEIEEKLKHVSSKFQAKLVFDQYLDPDIKASMILLKHAGELRKIEHAAST